MKLCTETITLHIPSLNYDSLDDCTPVTVSGVSWFRENISSVTEHGLKSADKITIRIPAGVFPEDVCLTKGMEISHGDETVTVLSWTDNRRSGMRAAHVKVVCA